jgi:hypothetical protein
VLCTITVLAGMTGTAAADPSSPWRVDSVSDGVLVERRSTPASRFDELRLSTFSVLSLQSVCDAIYPRKLRTVPERRFKKQVLLRETATERWTYEQISVPIVSDRDYVMHVKLEQAAATGHCSVRFETEDDAAVPPVPGFVRIPVVRGHRDVFRVADGRLGVQYRIFSEPGGGVPAFLARAGQRSAAVDFLKIILARADVPATDSSAVAPSTGP